ncbi:MAG TPA: universal stress protein [Steroidobacteraceae bacterium]|nr:universal stress protein [Steroidobacteraceae bacterium]
MFPTVNEGGSILVVAERGPGDSALLVKALQLARSFGAGLELFLCDAERAYALRQAYQQEGVENVRKACIAEALEYLSRLKGSAHAMNVPISIDAACESPLCEAIVRKARTCEPLLVVKSGGGSDATGSRMLDFNDWHLMRACPATLLLTRGRTWRPIPRVAAAVDVSEQETVGLARLIVQTASALAHAYDTDVELLYVERESPDSAGSQRRKLALEALAHDSHLRDEQVHLIPGEPEQELGTLAASEDYDILVVGTLTHRDALAPLVGTLTAKLVDLLDCDFMLVKFGARDLPQPASPGR